jgi:hypothetical protein
VQFMCVAVNGFAIGRPTQPQNRTEAYNVHLESTHLELLSSRWANSQGSFYSRGLSSVTNCTFGYVYMKYWYLN